MSQHTPQKIPATYMRGGTSKGLFFRLQDLPPNCQTAGPARDHLLMRLIGSPDPYGKHIDGMGGGTSSTSKVVILSPSTRPNHDVDYLFGQVAIDQALIDWSGNCGNLSAAVGGFAIRSGFINPQHIPENGTCTVRIWQANIQKTIIAHIPIKHGRVQEMGDFELDGVTFPAAEIQLEFLDPADDSEQGSSQPGLFPTGQTIDTLNIPGLGPIQATLINAGIPTIFIEAKSLGYTGTESQQDINNNPDALKQLEIIRAHGALQMGLTQHIDQAQQRQHTPKLAWIAPPSSYIASNGKEIKDNSIDLLVRAMSMGKLHHAMMGTAALAIGAAAAIPNTLVSICMGGQAKESIEFGHPSGTLRVGTQALEQHGQWTITKTIMSRSARTLMEGWVWVP
jgi:probable AcnD-accessory protein PrpF